MGGMNESSAKDILSTAGIAEMFTRFACAAFGGYFPEGTGSYAFLYAGSAALIGVSCLLVATAKSAFAIWSFMLIIQVPIGFMNCSLFGATDNVFPTRKDMVWPFTNLLLAVGFTSGPIIVELVTEATNSMNTGILVAGTLSLSAGAMFVFTGLKTRVN